MEKVFQPLLAASEYYWQYRIENDSSKRGVDQTYNFMHAAYSEWRLILFAMLVRELADIDPFHRDRRSDACQIDQELGEFRLEKSVVDALLEAPAVLGGIVISTGLLRCPNDIFSVEAELPAHLRDAVAAGCEACPYFILALKVPDCDDRRIMCAPSGACFYDTGPLTNRARHMQRNCHAPISQRKFYATILQTDRMPETIDPQDISPDLCVRYADFYDHHIDNYPLTNRVNDKSLQKTIGNLRQAIWNHFKRVESPPKPSCQKSPTHEPSFLSLPTHPIHQVMLRGLFQANHQERLPLRKANGHRYQLNVETYLNDVKESVHGHSSMRRKPHNEAALLKIHLHLVDQAFIHCGEHSSFWYDPLESLECLGYKRQKHGSFDSDTLQDHFSRLCLLANHWVAWEDGSGSLQSQYNHSHRQASPYWMIQSESGQDLALGYQGMNRRGSRLLLVTPGSWWKPIEVNNSWSRLPHALIALPVDGRKTVNRMTLRLGGELAVMARQGHKNECLPFMMKVGNLLQFAGITSHQLLEADLAVRGSKAKRLREYLAGEDGFGGVFARLRDTGAFRVDLVDETRFWDSGRGWLANFWRARLRVTCFSE